VPATSVRTADRLFPNNPIESSTEDFQCMFDDILSSENEILFITGDKKVWAKASDEDLLLLTAESAATTILPNLDFQRCLFNMVSSTRGNVFRETVWLSASKIRVSINGALNPDLMVWADYSDASGTKLKDDHLGTNVYIRPKRPALTALEDDWRVGPFSVINQTLSLKYGSIGEDITERDIEFYARGTQATGEENIDVNCFGQGGARRGSLSKEDDYPAGFGINTTVITGETLLAITFKSSIERFAGYNKGTLNAPTVEFCVKVTVGGKIYRQLAVKYTFNLNGAFQMDNAIVFDEDGTSEIIFTDVEYGIDAFLCDVAGVRKTASAAVTAGESIFICLESNNDQASVSFAYDLRLVAGNQSQAVVFTDEDGAVQLSNLAIESCADGKCKYEVILDQVMFQAIASEVEAPTTISVIGNAQMKLGILGIRRSLEIAPSMEGRSLEEVVGEISGEFEVTAANGVGSSASTRLGGGMLITTLVVAAFNLM
jgi:hypothetical protein